MEQGEAIPNEHHETCLLCYFLDRILFINSPFWFEALRKQGEKCFGVDWWHCAEEAERMPQGLLELGCFGFVSGSQQNQIQKTEGKLWLGEGMCLQLGMILLCHRLLAWPWSNG